MRALPLPSSRAQELVEHFSALGRVVRDLEVCGWASYLEQGDGFGTMMLSKQHPCYRCRMPQTPCRAGDAPVDAPAWDPAEVPELPSKPLRERASFSHGPVGQEVFAGWGGWTAGLRHQGFKCSDPVELYEDPLTMEGVRPEHDLSDPAVADRLRELAKAAPAPDVPNIWQFGSPCTTFCDFQLLNHGTRSFSSPEGDGTRAEELLGNQFADLCAELCESLYTCGREFAFESSAPSGRRFGTSRVCVACVRALELGWFLWTCVLGTSGWKRARQGISTGNAHGGLSPPGLYPWARLFLSRTCPGVGTSHVHVGLKGPSPSVPGAPRTRVAQQYGVALCAAWGLVVRAAYEHWDWWSTLAGKNVLTAIDAFVASSTGARPVPCLDSCQPWRAFPPPPTRGGGGC